ncbi:MAG: hypothetical protein VB858_08475, partial [Planctomycetaceae bacterium]
MSGKPAASPASPTAARKKSTAAKKTDTTAGGDDDDPFGVASAVTGKSIPLLAKPTKGRLHRVICPMCETAGFHSKQIVGRDVRCANKECLVPIFTAPQLEGETPAEAPRAEAEVKRGSSVAMLVGIIVLAATLLAGGAWFFTMPDGTTGQQPFDLPPVVPGAKDGDKTGTPTVDGTHPNGKQPVSGVETGPGFDELWSESLIRMVSDSRDGQNQRKAKSRQLTGEAFALRGERDEVNTQLKQLAIVAPRQKYLGIIPLVEYA